MRTFAARQRFRQRPPFERRGPGGAVAEQVLRLPAPRLQPGRAGSTAEQLAASGAWHPPGPAPGSAVPGFTPRFGEEVARVRMSMDPGAERLLRKERETAPAILPGRVAESWLYPDDPTGHVASIYFETFSSDLDEEDNAVLYGFNLLLEDADPPAKVTFLGHADSVGDAASNKALSLRRAEAVKAWFPLPTARTTAEAIGLGEQGPEATADNAAELSHYRRVDVIIEPPRTTKLRDWRSSGSKYGSETLKREMARALAALDAAITALQYEILGTPASGDTAAALERYFSHPRYRSPDFLRTLLGEIGHIREHIDSVHYREVQAGDIGLHCSTDLYRNTEMDWDRDLCAAIRAAQGSGSGDIHAVAFGYPGDRPSTIVLMPSWYRKSDPASILIHEAAHVLLGHRGHPTEVPHRDPYAIQGFVSELGSLKAPGAERKYPR